MITLYVSLSSVLFVAVATFFVWLFTRPRLLLGVSRRAVITGAASGLGKATLEYLVSRGDSVIALDVNEEALAALSSKYKPEQVLPIKCSVTDSESLKDAVATVEDKFGRNCVDAIINFAGIMREGPLIEIADKDFEMAVQINVFGTFKTNKAFFPLLKRDNPLFPARIINIASEVSYCNMNAAFASLYSMTKQAVEAYSTGLRQELMFLDPPVHVVVVNPGAFATPMTMSEGKVKPVFAIRSKSNSLFTSQMLAGEPAASAYIRRNVKPPIKLAQAIFGAIHYAYPPRRITVNVSYEMLIASVTPQFILDAALKFTVEQTMHKLKLE